MTHPNQMQVTLSFDREAMAQAGITEETILMVIKRGLSARIGEFEGHFNVEPDKVVLEHLTASWFPKP